MLKYYLEAEVAWHEQVLGKYQLLRALALINDEQSSLNGNSKLNPTPRHIFLTLNNFVSNFHLIEN